jgi:hypothetical protein
MDPSKDDATISGIDLSSVKVQQDDLLRRPESQSGL